jgi:hypothetical protein
MTLPCALTHAEVEDLLHSLAVHQQGEVLEQLVFRPTLTEWRVGGEVLGELMAIDRLAELSGYRVR